MIEHLNGNLTIISNNGFLIQKKNYIYCNNYNQNLWDGSIVAFEFDSNSINFDFQQFMEIYVYPDDSIEEDVF